MLDAVSRGTAFALLNFFRYKKGACIFIQNTRDIMNIMHENDVNLVGEVGKEGLAIENGKLWPNHVSSENSETIEITFGAA